MVQPQRSGLVPERRRLAVATLAVALVAAALFVPTFDAYVASHGIEASEPRVADAAVGPDGSAIELALRFENPTRAAVTVFSGSIRATLDGEPVTRVAGTTVERTAVPPGERATIAVTVPISPDDSDRAVAAVRSGELWYRGHLWVGVAEKHVKIGIRPQRVATDGG